MRSLMTKFSLAAALAAMAVTTPDVLSAQAYSPGECSVFDMWFFNGLVQVNASACAGAFEGNATPAEELAFVQSTWPLYFAGAVHLGKGEDGSPDPFVAFPPLTPGTLVLASPIVGPFVIVLKAASFHSYYAFWNDLPPAGVSELGYTLDGVVDPPEIDALSHSSIVGGESVVPEPSTVLLLGTGLLGLGLVGYRRRREA